MASRACIFDLDGVITDTAHFHFLAWRRLADRLGVSFEADDNERLKGLSRMESLTYILNKSGRQFSESETMELADEKNRDYVALIDGIRPSDILPGILDAFHWLRAEGWRIGLASASRNAPLVLDRLGISDRFDYVANSAEIPNGKPAPDIFLDVAAALDVPPNNCIGIEDAASGVQAIKAANMYAVGIGDGAILHQADIVMPSPKGLTGFFKSL